VFHVKWIRKKLNRCVCRHTLLSSGKNGSSERNVNEKTDAMKAVTAANGTLLYSYLRAAHLTRSRTLICTSISICFLDIQDDEKITANILKMKDVPKENSLRELFIIELCHEDVRTYILINILFISDHNPLHYS